MSAADDALRALCAGEPWGLDRRTEHLLPVVVEAMATEWRPSWPGMADETRRRAGYLLTVLCEGLPRADSSRWRVWLLALKAGLEVGPVEANDDVAREWGLARGLDVLRARRVLRLRLA